MANNKIVDREGLKAFRQANDTRYKNGSVVVGKSLTTKQIENINDEVGSTQTNPFLFQGTGTNNNTTETPTAPVAKHLELRGKTVNWKQLVRYNERNLSGLTCTVSSNGVYIINGTTNAQQQNTFLSSSEERIANHKYLWVVKKIGGTVDITGRTTDDYNGYGLGANLPNLSTNFTTLIDDETTWQIVTGGSDSNNANYFRIRFDAGVVFNNAQFICMCFDLTDIYGAGKEPTTYLQFVRDYPLPIYEYNSGELKSCNSSKLVTIGYNAFDVSQITKPSQAVQQFRSFAFIKVVPGQTYTIELDDSVQTPDAIYIDEYNASKEIIIEGADDNDNHVYKSNFIQDDYRWSKQLQANTKYIKLNIFFNRAISIQQWSNLLDKLTVHLKWDESKIGCEPFEKHEYNLPNVELHSAGSVYDTITPNGVYTKRIGVRAYESGDESDTSVITDLTNTYYALETPVVSEVSSFAENIEVDDFGTMEFVPSDSTQEVIVPQGNKFFYPADYVLFIDDMYNRSKDGGEDADVKNFVTQSELQEAVGDIDLSNYVNLTGTQTITGEKTFSNGIYANILKPNGNIGLAFANTEATFHGHLIGSNGTRDLGTSNIKWRDLYLSGNITDGTYSVAVAKITKKPSTSYSLSDGGTITDNDLKSLIQNEQPIKLNGFTCYFSCDDGTNYQYVSTRYDSVANKNHINVITIDKSTWVATFHTSDLAV